MPTHRAPLPAVGPLALLLVAACQPAPERREWRAEDHRHPPSVPLAADGRAAPTPTETLTPEARDARTGQTYWNVLCAGCHGPRGWGDGPARPPMAQVANLASPAWQASRTDAQIAQVIAAGKNTMPAFGERLDDVEIAAVVRHVRRLGGGAPQPPSATAAPEDGARQAPADAVAPGGPGSPAAPAPPS